MNSFETARGAAPGAADAPEHRNVSEIFPGASQQPPVVNGVNHGDFWTKACRRWTQHGMEAGMATAEYAIATLAAVGFAGLLVVILKSDEVRGFLLNIIRTALSF